MVVIREEIASSTLERKTLCAERGASNRKTLRTRHSRKYRSSPGPWTSFQLSLLLYRYGVMRFDFARFYSPTESPHTVGINSVFHQRQGFYSANLDRDESNRQRGGIYSSPTSSTQRYQAWK
jgi:hypothetical protein